MKKATTHQKAGILSWTLLIFFIIGTCFESKAQVKPSNKPTEPPKYIKVVTVPLDDFNTLSQALTQWKALVIYDATLTAEQKIATQQNINAYIQNLNKVIKLDSVKVSPPAAAPQIKK